MIQQDNSPFWTIFALKRDIMLKIENQNLRIELNELGGCLKSIYDKKNKEELLYQPNGESWAGQDIVIFPIIGALKNHTYLVQGKEYKLKNHGIIRYETVKVKSVSETSIELYYEYNEESLKIYPYKFRLVINYSLSDWLLNISYRVINKDDKNIYFSIGGHPALKASGKYINNHFDFEDTYCVFEGTIFTQYLLNNTGDQIIGEKNINLSGEYLLDKTVIEENKTLIYDAKDLKKVRLYTNDYEYIFNVEESPVLAIWSMKNTGNFICIEPWWGLPDYDKPILELKDKKHIISLNKGNEYLTSYSIEINKFENSKNKCQKL